MWDLIGTEKKREELNVELDSRKLTRNADGQFSTPNDFARAIVRETLPFLDKLDGPVLAIEPACGSGSFVSALLQELGEKTKITGIDKDPDYLSIAKECFAQSASFELADYLSWKSSEKADLIVTNPPYVRHHFLSKELKGSFSAECKAKGFNFSGLSDLFCYFIIKAMDDLQDGGVAAWLIPEEFLSVNYGVSIRRYLLQNFSIPRVHVFASEDIKFADALVSSCVFWVKKAKSQTDFTTLFTYGPDIEHPEKSKVVKKEALLQRKKWGQEIAISGSVQFKDLFVVKRGIATGANSFFIIDDAKAKENKIPSEFLTPVLPSARFVKVDHIEADQSGNPTNTGFMWLVDCRKSEYEIRDKYPGLWAYLESGKSLKEKSYICRTRHVWYWQDKRQAPMFFLTYMGRGRKGAAPFRFILNKSRVIANNSFLMLYPTKKLNDALVAGEVTPETLLSTLSSINPDVLESGGRKYGGGLKKIEPRELGEVYINAPIV